MKKIVTLLLCAVTMIAMLAGCSSTGQKNTASENKKEDKTINVATSGDYLGFTVYNESSKTWSGFEIDMWNEISKRIGYKVKFVQEDVASAFGDLGTGHVDTVAKQISITPARKEKYDFTTPYFFSPYCLMVKGDNTNITSWKDMAGKTIGLADGSAMNEFITKLDPNNKVKKTTYESFSTIPQEVVSGRVDAMPYAYLLIPYLIEKNPSWNLKAVDIAHPIYTEVNGYPFARTERGAKLLKLVNGALNDMIKDGTHKKLCEKWFKYDVMQTDAAKDYYNKNK
ncbi:transporter substrate-binding domain-containing protein [Clostridium ljungdahlii]|uniref:Putative amino-acid-binding protein YxeM n=1 Tax=Clostridium ljungdahlii TaxID=1538 RepID=A0A166SCQ4_9CLOT|nr:transporter substrate-binding domain-containing protein [Clostridium ljungdahlii]OAA91990.1 putative amino-acid-binding protein YxeM precursor [Clostridium ljungdahlii]